MKFKVGDKVIMTKYLEPKETLGGETIFKERSVGDDDEPFKTMIDLKLVLTIKGVINNDDIKYHYNVEHPSNPEDGDLETMDTNQFYEQELELERMNWKQCIEDGV